MNSGRLPPEPIPLTATPSWPSLCHHEKVGTERPRESAHVLEEFRWERKPVYWIQKFGVLGDLGQNSYHGTGGPAAQWQQAGIQEGRARQQGPAGC